ncbi:hypothetical protein L596_019161 [Steinernema carpocapsae]|uniref:Uncharacterized protein n=1 Tax=Steinernema carpocapsae TaxID=34508 RepID=A0A4V6A2A8_STECR|nr:hypothetical protein L596_019161 [Steinernema carpocapsae]
MKILLVVALRLLSYDTCVPVTEIPLEQTKISLLKTEIPLGQTNIPLKPLAIPISLSSPPFRKSTLGQMGKFPPCQMILDRSCACSISKAVMDGKPAREPTEPDGETTGSAREPVGSARQFASRGIYDSICEEGKKTTFEQ